MPGWKCRSTARTKRPSAAGWTTGSWPSSRRTSPCKGIASSWRASRISEAAEGVLHLARAAAGVSGVLRQRRRQTGARPEAGAGEPAEALTPLGRRHKVGPHWRTAETRGRAEVTQLIY